jgi:hypothetical protein
MLVGWYRDNIVNCCRWAAGVTELLISDRRVYELYKQLFVHARKRVGADCGQLCEGPPTLELLISSLLRQGNRNWYMMSTLEWLIKQSLGLHLIYTGVERCGPAPRSTCLHALAAVYWSVWAEMRRNCVAVYVHEAWFRTASTYLDAVPIFSW